MKSGGMLVDLLTGLRVSDAEFGVGKAICTDLSQFVLRSTIHEHRSI
jgi:hypothetical protein